MVSEEICHTKIDDLFFYRDRWYTEKEGRVECRGVPNPSLPLVSWARFLTTWHPNLGCACHLFKSSLQELEWPTLFGCFFIVRIEFVEGEEYLSREFEGCRKVSKGSYDWCTPDALITYEQWFWTFSKKSLRFLKELKIKSLLKISQNQGVPSSDHKRIMLIVWDHVSSFFLLSDPNLEWNDPF